MGSNVSISGLVSNLDTDSIVNALVSAYSTKKDKYVKAQTKLEWKQDAWKELNTKIYSFYSGTLSSLRFSNAFSKKASSVDSTKATVKASSDAVSGTQKLKIKQLAKSGYLTGAVVKSSDGSNTKLTGSSKLSELGIEDGSSISVKVSNTEKTITLNGSDSVNTAVARLKEAGLNASFDEINQRFFVSSKASGSEGEFSIIGANSSGLKALNGMGLNSVTSADVESYRYWAALTDDDISNFTDTDYTKQKTALYDLTDEVSMNKLKDTLRSTLEKANESNETLGKANKLIDYKLDAINEVSGLSLEERSALISKAAERMTEISSKKELTDEDKAELEELQAKHEIYVASANATFNVEAEKKKYEDEKTENQKIIDANAATIDTANKALADNDGFTAYVNGLNDDITKKNAELKETILDNYNTKRSNAKEFVKAYDIVNDANADKTSDEYKNALQLIGDNSGPGTGAVRIQGQDAIVELNGATFTSASNNFQINGLTITANQLTGADEEISITTNTDTQGIYDMIKGFFTEYNTLIKEMDSLYNADSAKGYEPLTDDEKEAMTDKEIEKWEEKIKKALLRRDDTLQSVSDSIKNAFQKSYEINGKKYSLSSFGIKTGGYFTSGDNEKSIFHIDGDSKDSTSSGNTDKLMAAIASDPDTVCEFFNKLADGVYAELSNKMKGTTLSSAYTVYNDKSMKNEYNEYTKTIKSWEEKIESYEEKYRKQFTAMEKALATLNSNSSSLTGLLGS
ncbi:flagellar hook-associated protein 2 [Eubacterium sp. CAG:603]|jgi:Flagellar capping protein|nr:flagellar hook-associated protein 2 [Eubacterium sp. CAG:603]